MNVPELWPAPMEGVFSENFIAAVNELQLVDRWMTSFFRLSEHVPKLKTFKEFLAPYMSSGLPVYAQLMGRDPELLAKGAALMFEAGAAGVNLNFGCPVPRVVKGRCGGAMLKEIELMKQIVSAVKAASGTNEVSVKLRSGFASPSEMEQIVPALLSAGTDKLFFHYRSVKEMYGEVGEREKRFARFMELAGTTPVILNGDFGTPEEITAATEHFKCRGIMLGRKFLSNPDIMRQMNGYSAVSRETFFYSLVRNGASGEGLKGLKRWIFGSWNHEIPPEGNTDHGI